MPVAINLVNVVEQNNYETNTTFCYGLFFSLQFYSKIYFVKKNTQIMFF